MEGFILLVLAFFFIIFHFIALGVIKRNKLGSKNKIRALNIFMALMLITYIALHPIMLPDVFAELFTDDEFPDDTLFDYSMSVIVLFLSPYFWIGSTYFFSKAFFGVRINKKTKIKGEFEYYRNDLSKVSPSIIAFVSNFAVSFNSCISSSLLKLKLEGYLVDDNGALLCTDKNNDGLIESEKLLLSAVKTKQFDKNYYAKTVENESVNMQLLKKVKAGAFVRFMQVVAVIALNLLVTAGLLFAVIFYESAYTVYFIDGKSYALVDRETYESYGLDDFEMSRLEPLERMRVRKEFLDSGVRVIYGGEHYIRVDYLEDSIGVMYNLTEIIFFIGLPLVIISITISLAHVIAKIRSFKYDFTRTVKGNILVNKAYGLRNYLKDFSAIKKRTGDELHLWEYYLIYAVALDVNAKIEDEVIAKFMACSNINQ